MWLWNLVKHLIVCKSGGISESWDFEKYNFVIITIVLKLAVIAKKNTVS